MLGDSAVTATLAVTDLAKARDFYENSLGLEADANMTDGMGVLYKAGEGTGLYIYTRPNPPTGDNTQATFKVADIGQKINDLSAKGVTFEQYDMPGLKTNEKGIAEMGNAKSAWFKDPDGNILALVQMS